MSNKHTYKYSSNVLTAQFEVATLGVAATTPSIQLTETAGGQLCRMRIDPSDGSIKFEVNDGAGGGWVDAGIGGGGGGGSFSGPGSSTDNAIVRFDGTGGATGQNSIPTIDDDGRIHSNLTALGDVLDYFFTGQTENNSEAIKIGFNASNGNHYWTEIESIGNADLSGKRNRSMRFNCRTTMDTATYGGSAVFVVNGEHYTAAATLVNAKLLACTNADSEVFSVGPTGLVEATGLNIGRVANNTVTGTYASVTSGQYNTAAGDYSTAAGDENEANGDYSGTLSGEDSVNDGTHSVIAGGSHNTISTGSYDAILGGWSCNITGTTGNNVVCGGSNNDINGTRRNFMGGGYNNEISAQEYNTLVGGSTNEVSGTHSFIGGGGQNLSSSNTGGVGWGNSNVCSGERAGVVCGTSNTASDKWTFIGGGTLNIASQDNAAICGGRDNTSTDYGTFVGGGYNNDATNDHASICGGELNVASGDGSHIGGGHSNAASGVDACVLGGLSNTAATSYSTAIGTEAVTRNKGELTQSAGSFDTAGDTQVRRLHLRRQTTDATPVILSDDNAHDNTGSWNCAYKTLQHYKVTVLGHRDNDTEFASFTMEGTVHRPDGTVPTSLWDSIESWVQSSAAWDSYVTVGSGGIKLYVVGEAAKNINWSASVELVESTVP